MEEMKEKQETKEVEEQKIEEMTQARGDSQVKDGSQAEEAQKTQETQGDFKKEKDRGSGLAGKMKKMGTMGWIITAIVLVAAAVAIGVLVYINSPSYKAHQALKEGERYLEDMDYDRAVASFMDALRIDPDNTEVAETIYRYLEDMLVTARSNGEAGNYSEEREIAVSVLDFDVSKEQGGVSLADALPEGTDSGQLFDRARDLVRDADKQELLVQADQEFENRNYEDAKGKYEEALEKGADESEVEPRLSLCEIYGKILDLCDAEDWEGLARYMDSEEFDAAADYMEVENPQYVSRDDLFLEIGERDGSYYVMTEDNVGGKGDPVTGTGVVSSANTYAVYTGEWAYSEPNGNGKLLVWYKNESMEEADSYAGTFQNGVVNGSAVLGTAVDETAAALELTVDNGAINLFKVDEDGNQWLCGEQNGGIYIIVNVKEENNRVIDYVAGVPGFGGSDVKVTVEYLVIDKEPPALSCSLETGHWYEDITFGKGITALDNVDGDITDQITYVKEQTKDSRGYRTSWECGYKVVYSATDAAGNTGTLTVLYDYEEDCGFDMYRVVKVE